MTRFARAKGSKASNERLPEKATSWQEMKQQMLDKSNKSQDEESRQANDQKKLETYRVFLEEKKKEEVGTTEWADFPVDDEAPLEVSSKIQDRTVKTKPKNKKKKLRAVETETLPPEEVKKPKKLLARVAEKGEQAAKKMEKELTEKELAKIEKKHQRRLKQVAKRKEMKEKQKEGKKPTMKEAAAKPQIKSNQKPRKDSNFKRKKPFGPNKIKVNGKELMIAHFDGFPIKQEDAVRLNALKEEMISKGLPRSQIDAALKLERRRAEKALAREKKMVCFHCRNSGHNLSECPDLGKTEVEQFGAGVCFKCGSTEHTHFQCKVVKGPEYKFATCFVCKEQGHISRQCPDNPLGMYPKGGACKECGDVTHLKKDCPQYQAQQQSASDEITAETLDFSNPDVMEGRNEKIGVRKSLKKRIVKLA